LWLGIIASITFPLIEITQVVYVEQPPVTYDYAPQQFATPMAMVLEQPALPVETPLDYGQLLIFLYAAVVTFFLGKMGIELSSLYRLIASGKKVKRGNFVMVTLSRKLTPFSFFNYICYSEDEEHSAALDIILDHEKVHARQWHSMDVLLSHLYRAVFWVNPLAWWLKKQIGENLEFIADAEAKTHTKSGMSYERALLSSAAFHLQPALANNFFTPFIKKRIIMLQKEASAGWNMYKYALILPVIVVFLYSFNVVTEVEYVENSNAKSEIEKSDQNEEDEQHENSFHLKNVNYDDALVYIKITSTTTKEELEKYTKSLKEDHHVDLKFSKLRYRKGKLTSIKMSLNDNRGHKTEHILKNNKGIDDVCLIGDVEGDDRLWNFTNCKDISKAILSKDDTFYKVPSSSSSSSSDMEFIELPQEDVMTLIKEEFDRTIKQEKVNSPQANSVRSKIAQRMGNDTVKIFITAPVKSTVTSQNVIYSYAVPEFKKPERISQVKKPLVIIDGIINEDPLYEQKINDHDIESVTVLKDKSATTLYGDAGKNGVVVIVTKKGHVTFYNATKNNKAFVISNGKKYIFEKSTIQKIDTLYINRGNGRYLFKVEGEASKQYKGIDPAAINGDQKSYLFPEEKEEFNETQSFYIQTPKSKNIISGTPHFKSARPAVRWTIGEYDAVNENDDPNAVYLYEDKIISRAEFNSFKKGAIYKTIKMDPSSSARLLKNIYPLKESQYLIILRLSPLGDADFILKKDKEILYQLSPEERDVINAYQAEGEKYQDELRNAEKANLIYGKKVQIDSLRNVSKERFKNRKNEPLLKRDFEFATKPKFNGTYKVNNRVKYHSLDAVQIMYSLPRQESKALKLEYYDRVFINVDTPDSQLNAYENRIKKLGVDFEFKTVKRNSLGQLFKIGFVMDGRNYKISNSDGIDEIIIHINNRDGIITYQ